MGRDSTGWGQDVACSQLTNRCLTSRRACALQEGLRQAVAVPLKLAETVSQLWPVLQELALCGNLACLSDLQVRGSRESQKLRVVFMFLFNPLP